MLTWEYPPRIVGGIARHCYGISRALANKGIELHVITLEFPGAPYREVINKLCVHRVKVEIGNPNFMVWVLLFNHFMEKYSGMLARDIGKPNIVHVHDWLTTLAGITLKHTLNVPLILTMHSTEIGRSFGLYDTDSFTKDSIEWWGCFEAKYVIVISESLRREVINHFKVPEWKVIKIPNGIDVSRFQVSIDRRVVRSKWGISESDKLIIAVGRLTTQKGFHILIKAFPLILRKYPNARLMIVGDGWMRGELERLAYELGVRDKIIFTGFVSDQELVALLKSADVMVIPSLYEPFGITTLEAMAAKVPVVVSQVGGLAEIIEHEKDGVWVYPGNPESIAWGVDRVLSDPEFAKYIVHNAFEKVKKFYDWSIIAEKVLNVYRKAIGDQHE